jgi:hypothetical protein
MKEKLQGLFLAFGMLLTTHTASAMPSEGFCPDGISLMPSYTDVKSSILGAGKDLEIMLPSGNCITPFKIPEPGITSVTCKAPGVLHCGGLASPTGRVLIANRQPAEMLWLVDIDSWSCAEIKRESQSREYWISMWKTERAKVQALQKQIQRLTRK